MKTASQQLKCAYHSALYPRWLLGGFAALWMLLALNPWMREGWLVEQGVTLAFVGVLVLTRRRFAFTHLSYTLILVFLLFHEIGSHFTYARVPYDAWSEAILGRSLSEIFNLQRNHYDRFVHFLFGLLMVYPIRDLIMRGAKVRGPWVFYLAVAATMSFSLLYELIEFAAFPFLGPVLGHVFIGAQGDEWDAQKDMATALLGTLITLCLLEVRVFLSIWRKKQ